MTFDLGEVHLLFPTFIVFWAPPIIKLYRLNFHALQDNQNMETYLKDVWNVWPSELYVLKGEFLTYVACMISEI